MWKFLGFKKRDPIVSVPEDAVGLCVSQLPNTEGNNDLRKYLAILIKKSMPLKEAACFYNRKAKCSRSNILGLCKLLSEKALNHNP